MTTKYNFTLRASRTFIDREAQYGYWERKDGSEGGGLWFADNALIDYDGAFSLPAAIIAEIRSLGLNADYAV
jgi:hypothetical protein